MTRGDRCDDNDRTAFGVVSVLQPVDPESPAALAAAAAAAALAASARAIALETCTSPSPLFGGAARLCRVSMVLLLSSV